MAVTANNPQRSPRSLPVWIPLCVGGPFPPCGWWVYVTKVHVTKVHVTKVHMTKVHVTKVYVTKVYTIMPPETPTRHHRTPKKADASYRLLMKNSKKCTISRCLKFPTDPPN